ncbi:MAG: LUD domain-containing protein [Actinomycetota bacterium]|nr:LUD domain-containing protein [Actinomycetota bacterium]
MLELWEKSRKDIRERVLGCADSLIKRDFNALPVPTISEANRRITSVIPRRSTVFCWRGVALDEAGLIDTLIARGNRVVDVYPMWTGSKKRARFSREDVYLASAGAITLDGIIMKPEPESLLLFSPLGQPGKTIIVIGENMIVEDMAEGFRLVKDIHVPHLARRFGLELECARKGTCVECENPSFLCTVHTVLTEKPADVDFLVVLVGEHLG